MFDLQDLWGLALTCVGTLALLITLSRLLPLPGKPVRIPRPAKGSPPMHWRNALDLVESELTKLGSTPDDIAAKLAQHKIKGVRFNNDTQNPIARYLATVMPEGYYVGSVNYRWIGVRNAEGGTGFGITPPPEAVQAFLHAFNRGEYPGLRVK